MVRLCDGDRTAFDVLLDELWPGTHVREAWCRSGRRRNRDALSWAFGIASYELMTYRRRVERRR